MMIKRYCALILVTISLSGPWLQASAVERESTPRGDGKLRLFNYHLQEFAEIAFRDEGGRVLNRGLTRINRLLRSRDNETVRSIDVALLDLIDHLQDHFTSDTVEIISAYRSPELNASLLQNGHAVSPVSWHMRGKALDIHLDEVREESLRDYAQTLSAGGVGYYGSLDFVHVDTGELRNWSDAPAPARKLVGVLDPAFAVQLSSDHNDYLPGEDMLFTWQLPQNFDLRDLSPLTLERFSRGAWVACAAHAAPQASSTRQRPSKQTTTVVVPVEPGLLPHLSRCPDFVPGPFGKYRWTFKVRGHAGKLSSNEFYLKKL